MHDPGRGGGGGGVKTNIVHVKQTPVRVYSGKMHFFWWGGGGGGGSRLILYM